MANTASITEKIIKLREQSGYTQEQVGEKLGLSRQRYILVEKGERDLTTEELSILADLFGVDLVDFFEEIPDIKKFQQMLYACVKFGSNNEHGSIPKTKLAKLLYLADFTKYYLELDSMSGVKYRRLEYGPVADVFFSMTDDLFYRGKIDIKTLDRGAQMISLTTREASLDLLNAKELKIIKKVCSAWKEKPTREIVNFTHEQLPWKLCRNGEYIPYSLIIQEDPKHVYQPAA